jgi:pSer/pThr/pTyr-binding forkhead associated (FHA) protein
MKSFLLSSLRAQVGTLALDAFKANHPYPWLLWEPGAWTPPSKNSSTTLTGSETPAPQRGGEALALALTPRDRKSPQVTLGRGPENDLEVNEGTLSQTHLVFMQGPLGWTVRDAGSKNGSWLDAMKLAPGNPAALRNGAKIRAAGAFLIFLTPEGMFDHLRQGAQSPRP